MTTSTCEICAKLPDYNYSSGFSADAFPPEVYRLVDRHGKPIERGYGFDGTTELHCPLCGSRYEFLCEVGFGEWDLTIKRLT